MKLFTVSDLTDSSFFFFGTKIKYLKPWWCHVVPFKQRNLLLLSWKRSCLLTKISVWVGFSVDALCRQCRSREILWV